MSPLDGEMQGEIEFSLCTPASDSQLAQNVAHALSLGLKSTQARKRLVVVANGPSAKSAPFDTDLPTLALNGALRQFQERGLAPTFWAACDPQPLVADFVRNAPKATTYLVASKCHPDVFKTLMDQGIEPVLWHVADTDIPGHVRAPLCCSITMCSMWEMRQAFGFTDLDVFGWDGSYLDGEHHAGDARVPNPTDVTINIGGRIVGDEIIGGRNFETTHSWAAEADFSQQFHQLARYYDINVTIHGDGMMKAMQEAALAD
jgi:hypothetical protein